jgi:iron complex outermembrane receptor protein
VNDYIQGVPSSDLDVKRVSAGNGDTSPLQYSNVSAEFYGFDTPYAVLLPFDFQLDGVLSFTRGERRDTDDDLYRIAPINGRTTLTYLRDSWSIAVEAVYAGRQNKVSDDNDETTTDARGAMNLFATWEPVEGLALAVGVDNVLNGQNVNHLSGTSRVTSSGAEKGERLPSAGRSFYGRISARF